MLVAYIDEIGETGAFVSREDRRYNTSPAFGYAGFILPESETRRFGATFDAQKRALFKQELAAATNPTQWEHKGADLFRPKTPISHPQNLRVFDYLVKQARSRNGQLFFYCDEKPLGTPKQTALDQEARESSAMQETLNRVARYADGQDQNVMVLLDQIGEETRSKRLPNMYGHILARAAQFPEMRRIIEPPMHVDSQLSANIQFADWIAACISRAIDYQLLSKSRYVWVADPATLPSIRGSFTYESKIHLWNRSVPDHNHSEIFEKHRRLHPTPAGQLVSDALDPNIFRRIKAAAERAH